MQIETAIIGLIGVVIGGIITLAVTVWGTQANLREARRAERRKYLMELLTQLIEVRVELNRAAFGDKEDQHIIESRVYGKAVALMLASSDSQLEKIVHEDFRSPIELENFYEKGEAIDDAIKRFAELIKQSTG